MAKKCAECGEKLKLTNKPWQYITTLPVFCSDEHRAAYERRAALEAQSKPQQATVVEKPVVEEEIPHKDPIRRFIGGQVPLVPSYWFGLWLVPAVLSFLYERIIFDLFWGVGYAYLLFLPLGSIVVGPSLIWSSRAVRKSASRYQGRKAFRDLAVFQANATPFIAILFIFFFLYLQAFLRIEGVEEVSADQLVEREGRVYKVGATEPYGGYSLLTDGNDVLTEKRYYQYGYLIRKQKHSDGEENGFRQLYFGGSDQVKESGHYEDGQKEGNWQEFHRNGQVASKVTYRRGCYVGRVERYHESGRLALRGNYADRPDCVGPVIKPYYQPREGVWEYFDEEGFLERRETPLQSEQKRRYLEENYDRSGALKSRGPKIEPGRLGAGQKDGSWEYFDEDGNLTNEVPLDRRQLVSDKDISGGFIPNRVDNWSDTSLATPSEIPVESSDYGRSPDAPRANWRQLKQGMPQEEIEALLGEPYKIESGEFFETWFYREDMYYRIDAYVRFDKPAMVGHWRVDKWAEPE